MCFSSPFPTSQYSAWSCQLPKGAGGGSLGREQDCEGERAAFVSVFCFHLIGRFERNGAPTPPHMHFLAQDIAEAPVGPQITTTVIQQNLNSYHFQETVTTTTTTPPWYCFLVAQACKPPSLPPLPHRKSPASEKDSHRQPAWGAGGRG